MRGAHVDSSEIFFESGLASGENQNLQMPPCIGATDWFCHAKAEAIEAHTLFCFPFAGGGAAVWHPWATNLEGAANVVGVRLPGRESLVNVPPLDSIDKMVEEIGKRLTIPEGQSFSFFGHGMGALLAFELVRYLRRAGQPLPSGLIVCASRAPFLPDRMSKVGDLPDRDFVQAIEDRFGAIPSELQEHPELIELLLPAFRADVRACESYQYVNEPPLDIPILALGAAQDALVGLNEVRAWRALTATRFEVGFFSGKHFFVQLAATAVCRRIARFVAGPLHVTPYQPGATARPGHG